MGNDMTDATPLPPPAAPAPSDPPLPRSLRVWALVAEIIGAAAVVVSLVFVGLQLNEANKLARSAATKAQIDQLTEYGRVTFPANAAELVTKVRLGQPLTPVEQTQMGLMQAYIERSQEGLYYQYLDGKIDPDLWEAHRAQIRATQVNNPYDEAFWSAGKNFYSPRYREFREADKRKATADKLFAPPPQPAAPGPTPETPKQ